jgi:hypothetical protein
MDTGDIYLASFILMLVVSVGLLIYGMKRPSYREVLFAASALMGAAGVAFLGQFLVYLDHLQNDRKISWYSLWYYGMNDVLLQYINVDNINKQLVSGKNTNVSQYLLGVELSPLTVYDNLMQSEHLPLFIDPNVFSDLAYLKSIELGTIKAISDKEVSEAEKLDKVHEYRDWLRSVWVELCSNAEGIYPTKDSTKCPIEDRVKALSKSR